MRAVALEQHVEGAGKAQSMGRRLAPFFCRTLHRLQEELVLISRFLVEHLNAPDNQENVSAPGKPGQVRQAFVERIPVLAEIAGELQGGGEFVEERGLAPGLVATK